LAGFFALAGVGFVGGFFGISPPIFDNFMVFPFVLCLTALR
jgi:hypothetical protein